jgi:hypothetical protein
MACLVLICIPLSGLAALIADLPILQYARLSPWFNKACSYANVCTRIYRPALTRGIYNTAHPSLRKPLSLPLLTPLSLLLSLDQRTPGMSQVLFCSLTKVL